MGYSIYITRRPRWSSDEGPEISLDEWSAIVQEDQELIPMQKSEIHPLTVLIMNPDTEWGGGRYLYYGEGSLFASKPTTYVLMKMLSIARILGARVIGEDDEIYADDGTPDRPAKYTVRDDW